MNYVLQLGIVIRTSVFHFSSKLITLTPFTWRHRNLPVDSVRIAFVTVCFSCYPGCAIYTFSTFTRYRVVAVVQFFSAESASSHLQCAAAPLRSPMNLGEIECCWPGICKTVTVPRSQCYTLTPYDLWVINLSYISFRYMKHDRALCRSIVAANISR